jgi:predicted acylesterase/phospholipase RssA
VSTSVFESTVAVRLGRMAFAAGILLFAGGVAAQTAASEPARPRVGLVLGGGGARGAAHIGVLEVLEKLRVPVDCVAGTSMGALVAGVYASGLSRRTMRSKLAKADWDDLFQDDPPLDQQNFRKKVLRQALPAGFGNRRRSARREGQTRHRHRSEDQAVFQPAGRRLSRRT